MTEVKRSDASATHRLAPIVGAFVAGAVGVLAFHQVTWWLLYVAGIIPDFLLPTQANSTARCTPRAFPGVLGRPLGDCTGLGTPIARPRELLGVRNGVRVDRAYPRRLVRRTAHQRCAADGRSTLDHSGGPADTQYRLRFRRCARTQAAPVELHLGRSNLQAPGVSCARVEADSLLRDQEPLMLSPATSSNG